MRAEGNLSAPHALLITEVLRQTMHQGTVISAAWFIGTLALSIVAAWALHVFVERPVEKKPRAWQNARREARTTAS